MAQIPCHTNYMAPHDCLQYHTGKSGTVRSWNYPHGTNIRNTLYFICTRQEEGTCGTAWSPHTISDSVSAFDFTGSAAKVLFLKIHITIYLKNVINVAERQNFCNSPHTN